MTPAETQLLITGVGVALRGIIELGAALGESENPTIVECEEMANKLRELPDLPTEEEPEPETLQPDREDSS